MIALFLVVLMFTLSLSGCLRNGKGGSDDEPGVVYEPGPYDSYQWHTGHRLCEWTCTYGFNPLLRRLQH